MNRYRFEMQVSGTAMVTVDAENLDEAVEKLQDGEWTPDNESQETDWNIPRNQDPRTCLLDTEYLI